MKNYIIVAVVILLAVAIPGYAYWQMKSNSQENSGQTNTQEPSSMEDNEETPANTTSIMNLLKSSGNISCTFSSLDDEQVSTQGEIYINGANQNFRGDFVSVEATTNTQTQAHVIRDQDWQYLWMDDQETGYKWSLENLEDDSLFGNQFVDNDNDWEATFANFDEQASVDYDCQPWQPDSKVFVPPADIDFVNFQDQMEALMQGMPMEASEEGNNSESNANACDSCQNLPPEAQQQCRQALGC